MFQVILKALDKAEVMARWTPGHFLNTTVVYLALLVEPESIAGYHSYGCFHPVETELLTFVSACPVTERFNLV